MDFEWAKEKHKAGMDVFRAKDPSRIWKVGSNSVLALHDKDVGTWSSFTLEDIDADDWNIVEPEFDISKNVMTVKDPKPHVEGMVEVIEVSGFKEYIRLVKDRLDKMSSDDDASAVLDLYGGDKI